MKRARGERRQVLRAAYLEALEARVLLSAAQAGLAALRAGVPKITSLPVLSTALKTGSPLKLRGGVFAPVAHTTDVHLNIPGATGTSSAGLTASQIRAAYGLDQVMFGAVTGDGTGQTVAIVDAYHYPTALADLVQFDAAMGLPDLQAWSAGGNTGAYLRVVDQTGGTNYPTTQTGSSTWEMEEALDIDWVHSIAPGANIILVEASSPSDANLISAAVGWARTQPGVCAVSMSFSQTEGSSQTAYDSLFTTPSGHTGITYLAATGDTGTPSGYPAYSPNVVAVGGTTLSQNNGTYVSESGWSGSGGGLSTVYTQPSYQVGVVTQSTTARANPDVAMNADPGSGVWIYDSYDFPTSPWQVFGGTSLATPMWAGIMAIVDQGRVLSGQTALDGKTQTLPKLYALPASDFHDITTGSNGYAAGVGYDLVTGRGSPVANQLIQDLIAAPSATPGTPVLEAGSDTGISSSDQITSLNNSSTAKELTFDVGSTIANATISIYANGVLIGTALATGTATSVTTNGAYALSSGAHTITAAQTQPGLGQSGASAGLTVTVDTTLPAVSVQSPSGAAVAPQGDLKLTFNEVIDTTSFSLAAITSFTDPGGNDLRGQITGYAWSVGNTVLDITFNAQSAVGSYQMVLAGQLKDLAGNQMAASYAAGFTIVSGIYAANMDSNPGWTFSAGSAWAWGVPQGLSGDPSSGHTGSNVVGYNLNGNYSRNVGPYYATTPAINCTYYQNITFSFWRWLGVNSSAAAAVQASADGGTTWATLWSNNGTVVSDTAWSQQTLSLPASFNGKSAVVFRFAMGPTGNSRTTYPGWNIDDVLVSGAPYVPSSISGQVFVDANGNGTLDSGETGVAGAKVFLDINGNGVLDPAGTATFSSSNVPLTIPDANATGITSSLSVANTAGTISQLTMTFNIAHTYDSDLTGYLIGPDGTQITLFSQVGGTGHNFTNTTLSDAGTLAISSGTAPFSGTYRPSPGTMGTFAGKMANGTWQFKVVDSVAVDVGTINGWSLAITTSGDPTTTTNAGGNYQFSVPQGTYTVDVVTPATFVEVGAATHTVTASAAVTGQNFAVFPTAFASGGSSDGYYLTSSGGNLLISAGSAALATPTYQISASLLSSGITFNFTGSNEILTLDFSSGAALGVNVTVNGVSGNGGGITLLGQGTGQTFTMSDYQIGLASGGGVVSYNTIDNMDLQNCRVNYSGSFSTLQMLTVDSGCMFYWS